MISFVNPGLIDVRAIKTMGVSVKESENPIGFFGTGLKYAIAIVLRLRGKVSIWRGLDEHVFGLREVEIRGKKIDMVTMGGEELAFTVDLGKTWEPWQAFREFYCNAMDEGGAAEIGAATPSRDRTTIHVEQLDVETCLGQMDRYFVRGDSVYSHPRVAFYDLSGQSIFYRGILVSSAEKPFRFAPNICETVELTEDRTLKSEWEGRYRIANAILECHDVGFLERWLTAGGNYMEHSLDLDYSLRPTDEFLSVVARLSVDPSRPLNLTAEKVLARYRSVPEAIPCVLLDGERAALAEAVAFCRALAYQVDEFPITVVESLGEGILGKADVRRRRVLIARRAIDVGDQTLAGTLLEEWVHIKHGHDDCSRGMQNFLLDAVMRLGREYLRVSGNREVQPAKE